MDYKDLNMWAKVSMVLLLIGGIDLGLAGLFGIDFIYRMFGGILSRLLYIAIGAGTGFLIYYKYFKKEGM